MGPNSQKTKTPVSTTLPDLYETGLKLDVSCQTTLCPFASTSNRFGTKYQFQYASGLVTIFMAYWIILPAVHSAQP